MEEDESFDEFYAKLKDIVNSAFNLGETIPKPKIIRKVLNLYLRDFMPRSPQLRNQRTLIKFLWQSWLAICRPMSWVWQGLRNWVRERAWHWRPRVVTQMSLQTMKILKWNPTLRGNSKSLWRMLLLKDLRKIASSPIRLSSRTKPKERRMLGMAISTLFP